MLKFVGMYFYWVVTIFSKNRAILVQQLGEENTLSKSVSSYFMTKKKHPTAIGPGGGGSKVIKKRFFLRALSRNFEHCICCPLLYNLSASSNYEYSRTENRGENLGGIYLAFFAHSMLFFCSSFLLIFPY